MEKKANYFIVGSFVMAAFAGILLFTLWIAGSDLDRKMSYYNIFFKGAVTGLLEGSTVNYNGVPVGTVKKIIIDPDNVEQVRVTVGIKSNIPIKEDSSAMLEMQGLTGYVVVQITGGTQDSPLLTVKPGQKYPVIMAKASNLQELFASFPEVLGKVNSLLDRLNDTVDKRNQKHLTSLLENMDQASKNLNAMLPDIHQSVKGFNETLHDLRKTALTINDVGQDMRAIISQNREGIATFTSQGLYEFESSIVEAKETLEALSSMIQRLETNPASFIIPHAQKGFSVPER